MNIIIITVTMTVTMTMAMSVAVEVSIERQGRRVEDIAKGRQAPGCALLLPL